MNKNAILTISKQFAITMQYNYFLIPNVCIELTKRKGYFQEKAKVVSGTAEITDNIGLCHTRASLTT